MPDSDSIPTAVPAARDTPGTAPLAVDDAGDFDEPLAGRYGRGGRPRTRTYVLSGIGIALLTAVVSWFGLRGASPAVSATVLGYNVISDQSTSVRFEVVKPTARPVICVIEALDVDSVDVGRTTVTIPAGQHDVTMSVTLRTSARAITGDVEECDQSN